MERRHHKFAVVIYLPGDLEKPIARLREKYDPFHNLVAAHVTMVFPFESQRSLEDLTAILSSELALESQFSVSLDTIGDFYPISPVIYWNIKDNERLRELYFRLYSRLGLAIPFAEYKPHVTIAREISHHRVMLVKDKIVDYLSAESFDVAAIDLVTALPGNKWVSVRTFPLIGGGRD